METEFIGAVAGFAILLFIIWHCLKALPPIIPANEESEDRRS